MATTHSLNVAVLSMGLAESLGCGPKDVRTFGVAGLLHDIGTIRIPLEVLTKAGTLTAAERTLMNQHPVDGARIILQSEEELDLAAAFLRLLRQSDVELRILSDGTSA